MVEKAFVYLFDKSVIVILWFWMRIKFLAHFVRKQHGMSLLFLLCCMCSFFWQRSRGLKGCLILYSWLALKECFLVEHSQCGGRTFFNAHTLIIQSLRSWANYGKICGKRNRNNEQVQNTLSITVYYCRSSQQLFGAQYIILFTLVDN